ncbi:MAG: hypothetical protein KGJ06_02665 [Pseudomonadota bacterium]|nr:hypothetical protein [Pseudomonadota bacterium]
MDSSIGNQSDKLRESGSQLPREAENLRQESDRMMKEAEKQKAAMPRDGEPIGGG